MRNNDRDPLKWRLGNGSEGTGGFSKFVKCEVLMWNGVATQGAADTNKETIKEKEKRLVRNFDRP